MPSSSRMRGAAFEIRADQQRQLGLGLQLIGQDGGRIRLTLHDAQRRALRNVDEPAAVQIGHVVHHLRVGRGVGRRQTAVIRGEEKLADLLVDAHFLQRRFDPLAGFGGSVSGRPQFLAAPCCAASGILAEVWAIKTISAAGSKNRTPALRPFIN